MSRTLSVKGCRFGFTYISFSQFRAHGIKCFDCLVHSFIRLGIRHRFVGGSQALTDNPTFHPGRTARFTVENEEVALLGEIHPDVAENYSIGTKVYVASISVDKLFKYQHTKRVYKPSPRFPALTRDLAVVCDRITPVLLLEKLIAKAVGKTLEHISLFDVYQGEQIEKGKKSVAYSVTFRADDRTLTDDEVQAEIDHALKSMKRKYRVKLRV